jgi:hypothetical protein
MMTPTQIPGFRHGHVPAISLWQPWASAWISPLKHHETRSWETLRRGPLVVHASKARTALRFIEGPLERSLVDHFGPNWRTEIPFGALIGTVELIDCERIGETFVSSGATPVDDADHAAGDWTEGRFAWRSSCSNGPFRMSESRASSTFRPASCRRHGHREWQRDGSCRLHCRKFRAGRYPD